MMTTDRCVWAPGWNAIHRIGYGLSDAKAQVRMEEPGPGQRIGGDNSACH